MTLSEDNATRDLLGEKNECLLYPDDKQAIKEAILDFYRRFQEGKLNDWPAMAGLENYNRAEQTRQLARIFDKVIGSVKPGLFIN